jgi:hypothetical protein
MYIKVFSFIKVFIVKVCNGVARYHKKQAKHKGVYNSNPNFIPPNFTQA